MKDTKYFSAEAMESENKGEEIQDESNDKKYIPLESSNSKSREDADRSLMVVLPFKASEEDDIEELYTRRPIVQMVDTSSSFGAKINEDSDEAKGKKMLVKYSS